MGWNQSFWNLTHEDDKVEPIYLEHHVGKGISEGVLKKISVEISDVLSWRRPRRACNAAISVVILCGPVGRARTGWHKQDRRKQGDLDSRLLAVVVPIIMIDHAVEKLFTANNVMLIPTASLPPSPRTKRSHIHGVSLYSGRLAVCPVVGNGIFGDPVFYSWCTTVMYEH
ncbi:hypothetical protein J6590_035498 [Homalodisca vitripennis]|nr:hypothetical protein J6590_035498 [Homalodisca vitripennis]